MDYLTLQNGTKAIQSFLNVSSFTPKEALDISLKSLDILIAFELANKKVPQKIRQCLLDYSNFFLEKNTDNSDIKNILNNKKKKVDIKEIINLHEVDAANSFIFQKIFLNGLDIQEKIEIDLFESLIFHIKNLEFHSALIVLLTINQVHEMKKIFISKQEHTLLNQAYKYIYTFSESTDNHSMLWKIKILNSKRIKL